MTFGVPQFGLHFKWREPLAVRHVVAPDPWHISSATTKLKRSAIAVIPFVLLIAFVSILRRKQASPVGWLPIVVLAAGVVFLGLLVGFGIPLANQYTRRTIRLNQDKIMVHSGVRPGASKYLRPIFNSYERDHIATVAFERKSIKDHEFDTMRIRMKWGDEAILGIGLKESVDEIRSHMKQWGYPVT